MLVQAAICVVRNMVPADQCARQTYSCPSCVAAGAACGPNIAFLSSTNCDLGASDTFITGLDRCFDFCSAQDGSVAFELAEYEFNDDYFECQCLIPSDAADGPCRATSPADGNSDPPLRFLQYMSWCALFSRPASAYISDACDVIFM